MTEKTITIDGTSHALNIERDGSCFRARDHEIELVAVNGNEAELRIAGQTLLVPFLVTGSEISFAFNGEIWIAEVSVAGMRSRAHHRDHSMAAPMPGVVLKILVKPGDEVTKGMSLLILEAMKMEHQVTAPHDGVVATINCKEGDLVQPGSDLVTLA